MLLYLVVYVPIIQINNIIWRQYFVAKSLQKGIVMKNHFIQSPLNYMGGKYRLLPQIYEYLSGHSVFVDLFCGGANVGVNMDSEIIYLNDINQYVIRMLRCLRQYDTEQFIAEVDELIEQYGLTQSHIYGISYYKKSKDNLGLSRFNKEGYLSLRNDFNTKNKDGVFDCIMFFTIIAFAFNNQIRFNSNNEYNMPVGKSDFNKRLREKVTNFSQLLKTKDIHITCKDFRVFDKSLFTSDTIVYCDIPYIITDGGYTKDWNEQDERDILSYLDTLPCHFALSNVLEANGRSNDILKQWCKDKHVEYLEYNYNNSSYHKKDRVSRTQEVLVMNF